MIHICYAPITSPQPIRLAAPTVTVPKLIFRDKNQPVHLLATDITWLEGSSNYTFIHTRDKRRYLVAKNLKRLEADLMGAPFCRAHKSALVNLACVLDVSLGEEPYLRLAGGQLISISRRRLVSTRVQIRSYQRQLAN